MTVETALLLRLLRRRMFELGYPLDDADDYAIIDAARRLADVAVHAPSCHTPRRSKTAKAPILTLHR